MLRGILFLIKLSVIAIVILILGNTLEFQGKTISDQVKVQMSHAQRSKFADQVKKWTGQLTRDLGSESIQPTEQEKLKALIRKLNSPEH